MLRKEKERIVEELYTSFEGTSAAILADYRGLSVAEMTLLRNQLRQASVNYRVVKNSLFKLALKNTDLEPLIDQINGPTAVAYSHDDLVAPAKILTEFSKEQPRLEIKGGVIEGKLIDEDGVEKLAKIPAREVLLARLVSILGSQPTHLVTVLALNLQRLVQVLNAIRLQKEKSP